MHACPATNGQTPAGSEFSARLPDHGSAVSRLLEGSNDDRPASAQAEDRKPAVTDKDIALGQARRTLEFIYAARDCFPAMRELADHPGWEMVLHLFISGHDGLAISTADLCKLTGTWRPLAVRYIDMLFERGLVEREISAEKPDNWALRLTPAAEERLQELLCGFASNLIGREELSAAN